MDSSASQILMQGSENNFFLGYSNGYCLKVQRKLQHYNSIETGLSLILNLDSRFTLNSCFMVFEYDSYHKLLAMSSTCLQMLGINQKLIDTDKKYSDIFLPEPSLLNEEKKMLRLDELLRFDELLSIYEEEDLADAYKLLKDTYQVYR